jgi:ketosteroid isomerase-like protein
MTTTAPARTKAITDMFGAIDSGDYSTAFDYLADDITLVFSNAPAAHG